MRLFVAIELDDAARAAIDRERQRLMSAMGPAARQWRWVRTEHLHVTLVFLGEIDTSGAAAVVEAFGRDLDQAPYDMTIAGLGVFPTRGVPRTLWLGVGAGAEQTIALQALVVDRLPASIGRDARPFTPHLTLARWRSGHASRYWMAGPSTRALAVVPVEGVTLFESRLSDRGPAYTALARPRLTCPRA